MAETSEVNKQIKGKLKRKRSANWESIEKNLLRMCMSDFVAIVENKNTDTNTNKCKTDAWEKITQRFNELNNRKRTLIELKQQWRTLKLEVKKTQSPKRKMSVNSTGGGPESPSSSPESLEECEIDSNIFDCDGRGINPQKEELESPPNAKFQEIFIHTTENTDENLTLQASEYTTTDQVKQKPSRMKRKLPFTTKYREANRSTFNRNGPKYWNKEFSSERNRVLINCIEEEHAVKMKNIVEMHSFAVEEHNLKIEQMLEAHHLLKEESQLRIKKHKLEIFMLNSKMNKDK